MTDLQDSAPDSVSKSEKHIYRDVIEVGVWGAIGGFSQETLFTFRTIQQRRMAAQSGATSSDGSPAAEAGGGSVLLLFMVLLLGAVSAIIGTFLATEPTSSRQKTIALAIVFGLYFPSIIQTAIRTQNVESEKVRVETNAQQASRTLDGTNQNIEQIEKTLNALQAREEINNTLETELNELKANVDQLKTQINQSQQNINEGILNPPSPSTDTPEPNPLNQPTETPASDNPEPPQIPSPPDPEAENETAN